MGLTLGAISCVLHILPVTPGTIIWFRGGDLNSFRDIKQFPVSGGWGWPQGPYLMYCIYCMVKLGICFWRSQLDFFFICSEWPWTFQYDLDRLWSTCPCLKNICYQKHRFLMRSLGDMSSDRRTQQQQYAPPNFFSGSLKIPVAGDPRTCALLFAILKCLQLCVSACEARTHDLSGATREQHMYLYATITDPFAN
jgi:hypothetical protein